MITITRVTTAPITRGGWACCHMNSGKLNHSGAAALSCSPSPLSKQSRWKGSMPGSAAVLAQPTMGCSSHVLWWSAAVELQACISQFCSSWQTGWAGRALISHRTHKNQSSYFDPHEWGALRHAWLHDSPIGLSYWWHLRGSWLGKAQSKWTFLMKQDEQHCVNPEE